jgi:hypothetical protein
MAHSSLSKLLDVFLHGYSKFLSSVVNFEFFLSHHQFFHSLFTHKQPKLLFYAVALKPPPYHLLNENNTLLAFSEIIGVYYTALVAFEKSLYTNRGAIFLKKTF